MFEECPWKHMQLCAHMFTRAGPKPIFTINDVSASVQGRRSVCSRPAMLPPGGPIAGTLLHRSSERPRVRRESKRGTTAHLSRSHSYNEATQACCRNSLMCSSKRTFPEARSTRLSSSLQSVSARGAVSVGFPQWNSSATLAGGDNFSLSGQGQKRVEH